MMLTRCPACQTVFRLRAEQLRARHGEVRCGHCFNPFNALDHLLAESPGTPPAAPPGPAPGMQFGAAADRLPDATPPPHPVHTMEAYERPATHVPYPEPATAPAHLPPPPTPADTTFADTTDALLSTLDFDIPDDLVGPSDHSPASIGARHGPGSTRTEPTLDEISFSTFFEPDITTLPLEPDPEHKASPSGIPSAFVAFETGTTPTSTNPFAPAATELHPPKQALHDHDQPPGLRLPDVIRAERRAAHTPSTAPSSFALPDAKPEPEPVAPASAVSDSTESEWVKPDNEVETDRDTELARPEPTAASALDTEYLDATYGKPAPPTSGVRRTLWGLAVGLLAGTLMMQTTYLFRQDIARTLPGLRPLLVAACDRLGCDIPLPREAALIAIETSDLQSEPGRKGRLILHAIVRNRAPFVQAWPHLEITLTDGADTPLARRVLAPPEWVAPGRLEAGFAAQGDAVVRQMFEVTDLAPAGYRVYVFYP